MSWRHLEDCFVIYFLSEITEIRDCPSKSLLFFLSGAAIYVSWVNNLYFLENQEDLRSTNIAVNVKYVLSFRRQKREKRKKPNTEVFSQGLSKQHLIWLEILAFLCVSYWFTLWMTVAACLNITFTGAGKGNFRDATFLQSLQICNTGGWAD